MGKRHTMTAGGTATQYNVNMNGNQGGGNKKQGLPPTGGRPGWLSNFIRTSAGGYFRGIPGPVDPCPTKEETVDYNIDSQEKAYALRGVTKIIGDLRITGNITDWTPFDCLKEITGRFSNNDNAALETITGFDNLATIGGYFSIINNAKLGTISGFGNLATIVGGFSIYLNPEITEISGFGRLETVGEYLSIYSNDNLTEISGFSSLTTIGSYFDINFNAKLTTISGFDNLATIGGGFSIYFNDNLTDASSLWNVVSVGGNFSCYRNIRFTNAAFATLVTSLKTIKGNINVNTNNGSDWNTDVWTTEPKLKWGATAEGRKLNGGTNATVRGNFSEPEATKLFTLPVAP